MNWSQILKLHKSSIQNVQLRIIFLFPQPRHVVTVHVIDMGIDLKYDPSDYYKSISKSKKVMECTRNQYFVHILLLVTDNK